MTVVHQYANTVEHAARIAGARALAVVRDGRPALIDVLTPQL